MPRAPITPSIVAGPVGRGTYSAQDVAQVQPQQPGMLVQQGQQLQRLGGALEDVAEVQRIKQVEALATELDTKFAESVRNSQTEYLRLEGRAAADSFQEYEKGIRDSAKKLLAGVQDPLAQKVINQSAEQRVQHTLNVATAHREKQRDTWLKGSVETAMQGAIEDYKQAVAAGDPDADRFARTAMLYRQKRNAMDGKDENQNRISELALTTTLHGGAVDGMIEREEFGKAAAYLQKHKGEIAVDFFDQRSRIVNRGATSNTAYKMASDALEAANGDPFKALEAVRGQGLSADLLQETEQRIRVIDSDARRQRADAVAEVLTNAEAHILSGRPLSDDPELFEKAKTSGVLPQLMRLEESYQSEPTPEQKRAYQVALAETFSMSDAELSRFTRQQLVVGYWGKLPKGELESLLTRRDAAARRIQEGASGGANVLTDDDLILKEFMHWRTPGHTNPKTATFGHESELWEFKKNLQEQINAERQGGRPVTAQRIRELAENVGTDMTFLGSGGDPMPRLLLTDEEEREAGVPVGEQFVKLGDIPSDVEAYLINEARADGLPANFASVAKRWVKLGSPKNTTEIKRRAPK